MAYIESAVLKTLSEKERLILYLIGQLEGQAGLISRGNDAKENAIIFLDIRFLSTELVKMTAVDLPAVPRPASAWAEDEV